MSSMSLNDLYAKLRSKAFSDPSNGDLLQLLHVPVSCRRGIQVAP